MTTNLFNHIASQLKPYYDDREVKALTRIIIEDLLHLSLTKVMAGIEAPLSSEDRQRLNDTIARLKTHEPIQYIMGETQFCDLPIGVNPSVLIPRPETEQIAAIATSLFNDNTDIRLMDACTGSGCIAIAIKSQRPQWTIDACDISPEAIATARANAEINNVNINFSKLDLLSNHFPSTHYDIIVSNPPYVMNKEKATMQPNVLQYEPHLALFVADQDSLVFYQALSDWGQQSLYNGGMLLVEINHLLAQQTMALFKSNHYTAVTTINDMFNKPRFILCKKKENNFQTKRYC